MQIVIYNSHVGVIKSILSYKFQNIDIERKNGQKI